MARWKFCASTTFEILPLSTCTLCPQKSYISKGIQPIFENFASARRCWGWAFVWKVSDAEVFYFCNGKVKTLRIDNIWNFPLSTCTLCQQKILYLQSYRTDIRNLYFSSKMLRVAFAGEISGAQLFYFCNGKVKTLRIDNIWNFSHSNCTLCQVKSYISKGIQRIFENFASARRCWGLAFGGKVSGAHMFYFCNGKVKTLCIDNIWNFATFNLYTVPAKILYLQRWFNQFSKSFASARRCWGWVFGWKVSDAQVFYFCNGKVKTLRIENIWNFATFNLYTVPAKILYLQRYSTDFRKLCFGSKMLRVGILL